MLVIYLTCLLIAGSSAQSLGFGHCPTVKTIDSLDASKYSGLWYEYERSFPNSFEFAGKCVTANYTNNGNGTIKVVNRQISSITGQPSSITGEASVDQQACGDQPGCGKLTVKFQVPIVGETTGSYWVLDTDYETYSAVWSCTDYTLFHASFAWVLTRERNPSDDVVNKGKKVFADNSVDNLYMVKTDQENCD